MEFSDLMQKVKTYAGTPEAEAVLAEAYHIAARAHQGFLRVTGEPFLKHPLTVAAMLADWHAPPSLVAVALLHDIQSPEYSSEDCLAIVERRLGANIFASLQAIIRLNSLFRRIEKDFASSAADINDIGHIMALILDQEHDIVAIKMADRLHNLQTIFPLTRELQERSARIGFNLLIPLADKLGMAVIKRQLEDCCFEIMQPTSYQALKQRYVAMNSGEIRDLVEKLQETMHRAIPDSEVCWSPVSLYTLHRNQIEYNKRLGKPLSAELPPLKAIDTGMFIVLTSSEIDCYRSLGILHGRYQPVERHFHDYIGNRKDNGYQALHTQIKPPLGNLLNISICTHTMHLVAEYGITARWSNVPEASLPRLAQETRPEGGEIQVLTPAGETRNMSVGATLLDFAYEIHTDLGHQCIGGLVNGEHAELSYQLQAGDRIELLLGGPEIKPSLKSLEYVKTSQAASRIRQWLTLNDRAEMIERGRVALERRMREVGFDVGEAQLRQLLTQLAYRGEQFESWEDLLISIAVGRQKVSRIVDQLQSIMSPQPTLAVAVHALSPKDDVLTKVYARCCNPSIPEDIIGCIEYRGKEQVLVVHANSCLQIKGGKELTVVPVKWDAPMEPDYMVVVEALDRKGLAADLTRVVTLLDGYMQDVKVSGRPDRMMAEAQILLGKTTTAQRTRLQEELSKVPYVTHVELIPFLHVSTPVRQPIPPGQIYAPNPYGPKLALGTRFYGREIECQRISALLRQQEQNTTVLLWGQKRIGKSSLLLHLTAQPDEDFVLVFVDVQSVSDGTTTHFLRHLMVRIRDVFNEKFPESMKDVTIPHLRRMKRDPLTLFDAFLSFIQARIQDHQMVLILDEFQCLWSLQEAEVTLEAIFNRLRSHSQYGKNAHLILSGGGLLSQLTRLPGTAALFNTAYDVKLNCLRLDAASQLVRDGLTRVGTITDDAVQYLLTITAGHPFYLQLLCWKLYELVQERQFSITSDFTAKFVDEWLCKADSSRFQHLWEASSRVASQRNKVVLSAIAQLGSDTCETEYGQLVDLVGGKVMSEQNLVQTLEDLTNLGVLKHNSMRYAIAVELFARWLRQHWPLELVLKEASL
jgi:guanosine-3',5'-bis(diphosphate) 3'-pyrophosphohydrolase